MKKKTAMEYLTPPQYAAKLGVKPEKIVNFIKSGELRAIDTSMNPGEGKPRFRIRPDAIIEFEEKRTPKPAAKPQRRRKRDPEVIEFF